MNEVQHLCGMVVVFTVAVAADSIAAWGRHCQSSMQKQTAYGTHRKSKLVSLVFCSRSVWQSQTNFAVFSWARRPSFEFTQAIAFHRTGTSSVDYPNVSSKHACFLDPGCQSFSVSGISFSGCRASISDCDRSVSSKLSLWNTPQTADGTTPSPTKWVA